MTIVWVSDRREDRTNYSEKKSEDLKVPELNTDDENFLVQYRNYLDDPRKSY